VSERSLEINEGTWPLVVIAVSVLATFASATILLWFLLLVVEFP
jgi:hypothetical protein